MLSRVTKKQWFIIGGCALFAIATTLTILFWPPQEIIEEEPPLVIEPLGPSFLEVDGAWADSVLAQLTPQEKVGQLILVRSRWDKKQLDSLEAILQHFTPAGFILNAEKSKDHVALVTALNTAKMPFLLDVPVPLDLEQAAPEVALQSIVNDSMRIRIDSLLIAERHFLGTNFSIAHLLATPSDPIYGYAPQRDINERFVQRSVDLLANYQKHNMLGCAYAFVPEQVVDTTLVSNDSLSINLQRLSDLRLPALVVPSTFQSFKRDTAMPLREYFHEGWHYNGLIVSEAADANPDHVVRMVKDGTDLILTDSADAVFTTIYSMLEGQEISKAELDYHVRRVLMAKEWIRLNMPEPLTDNTIKKLKNNQHEVMVRQSHEHSITFVNNSDDVLPFGDLRDVEFHLVRIGSNSVPEFMEYFLYYDTVEISSYSSAKTLNVGRLTKSTDIVIALNDIKLDTNEDTGFFSSLLDLDKLRNVVIVNFKHPENLALLEELESVVQVYDNSAIAQELAAQAIFGGVPITARLPFTVSELFAANTGYDGLKTRLGFTLPEEFGMSSDSLNRIDWIAKSAIWGGATPGCQVLIAKEGKVIYNKSFGQHTYDSLAPFVRSKDMYDLASVTKIAATTMTAMYLMSRDIIDLDRGIGYLFPDTLKRYSKLQNITFRDLLLHQTGLSSAMPIYSYMSYRDELHGVFDMYYCDYDSTQYTVEVGEHFYMDSCYQDSIWIDVHSSWPGTPDYKYSDLNMNLLYYYLSEAANKRMDSLMVDEFFKPLGLRNISYLPRLHYPLRQIVPTEDDNYWRFQLLDGYVHDPSAAMMGGVAGNAGLFSNAFDLAVMMQVVLQKGSYGGVEFFSEKTANEFITRQVNYGSNRGLGFNMQGNTGVIATDAPMTTYGHTGFTGNCTWIDPENEIVYVFLSNRVHPTQNNKKLQTMGVRGNIHQAVYDALPRKAHPEPEAEPVL